MSAQLLPRRFTEAEAAAELGKSVITLRRYRKAGRIAYGRIGRDVYFTADHLRAFLDANECPAPSTKSPTNTPSSSAPAPRSSTSSGGKTARRSGALQAIANLSRPSDAPES